MVCSSFERILQQCGNDGVALDERHVETRRSKQERIVTQACGSVDRARTLVAVHLDLGRFHKQFAIQVGWFQARQHACEIAPHVHGAVREREAFGALEQREACFFHYVVNVRHAGCS